MQDKPVQILFVEDEEGHIELVRRAFGPFTNKFCLIFAGSLEEARTRLVESQPGLIFADLALPDGQGIELLSTPLEESH